MRDDVSVPRERPRIRVLMARPGRFTFSRPKAFAVADLLDLPRHQLDGWTFCGVDPEDEREFLEWRKAHPEV